MKCFISLFQFFLKEFHESFKNVHSNETKHGNIINFASIISSLNICDLIKKWMYGCKVQLIFNFSLGILTLINQFVHPKKAL